MSVEMRCNLFAIWQKWEGNMKKKLLFILFVSFLSLRSFAATNFVMTFTTPTQPGGGYKPKNVVAVWVTTAGGAFVKTICRYAQSQESDLQTWYVNGKTDSDTLYVDGKMGATRSSLLAPSPLTTIAWDLKDRAGTVISDGTYNINFEITDGVRKTYSGTFVKDSTPGTRTIPNNTYFANISITYVPIGPPNTPPVAQAQSVTTAEDTPKAITLVATDVETNALTYAIVTNPAHGTLSAVTSNLVTYTPALNYNGPDNFTFRAYDGTSYSSNATVSITVTPVNDAPVAQAQNVTNAEDTAKSITLVAVDPESNPIASYIIASSPLHGTLSGLTSNVVTYTPATNYYGPDSFTFRASDASLTGATATVSITVTSVNDAPVAQAQSVSTAEDTAKAITLVATDIETNALTYIIATNPTYGTLSGLTSNVVTYTPATNYNGPDSFTFRARDASLTSTPVTVSITITPVNDGPIAQAQSVTNAEDTAKSITLVAIDPESDAVTSYSIASSPLHGTLSGLTSNVVIYTPATNYYGPDSFTFRASDATLLGTPATVSITVTPVNDAPVAQVQNVSTAEDIAKVITLGATDIETNALTYAIVTNPSHGTLSGLTSNVVTYTPDLNYYGPDTFTFRASDASLTSTPATVSITVTPVNDAPVAQAQSVSTAEDTAKAITLAATDVETNALTYAIATNPSHGTLSGLTSNVVTYTPDLNYNGPDSFTFRASDASLTSTPVTVSINVTPVNDVPVAQTQSVSTAEDTAKAVTLGASDPENDVLAYTIVSNPSHGVLSGLTSNVVTYTPDLNYNGPDSFAFRASDSSLTSTPATVSITVTPVNDAPVPQIQSVSTAEDTAKAIILFATDIETNALSYAIVTNPSHGTLSGLTSNVVTYTPDTNYFGSDSFTFRASDASLTGTPATVSITVTPVNDAPVAQVQSVTVGENAARVITLSAIDIETNALTYAIVTTPLHGALSVVTSNKVTYTPALNYTGSDSFTFKANDGLLDSAPATVSLNVIVNNAPVAQSQTVTHVEDTAKSITLVATDFETNSLTYAIVSDPAHGTLSVLTSNVVTYTPAANYNGPDSFTFKANDGTKDSNEATVSITVTPVNDAPVPQAQSVTIAEDTATNIILVAVDPDNDPLTYTIVTSPTRGALSGLTSNVVTYTPATNYFGPDSFSFRVNDASLTSTTVTVSLTVTPVNDAPVVQSQSVTTAEDTAKTITLGATDVETNALTYAIATNPSHGTLSVLTSNVVTYTPDANYNGPDSFTFQASDASLTGTPATVSITVTSVNDAPVAQAQSVTTAEDTAKVITLDATDVETNALTYTIVANPTRGTLSVLTSNVVTYTPSANYYGLDSFTFRVNDASLTSTPVTVTITVTPVNDAPVAQAQSVSVAENFSKLITMSAIDVETNDLTYVIVTTPSHGTLSVVLSNTVLYTPALNYTGPDSFTFKANDGSLDSAPATVSLNVIINNAPVAQSQSVTNVEDTAKAIKLLATDVETNNLTYVIVSEPSHGVLSGLTSNVVTYTPEANYNGPDTFTFKANDGMKDSNEAIVSITVTPVNDVPVAQAQSVTKAEDTATLITLVGTDVESSPLTYMISTNPSRGTLSILTSNVVTYTPATNYYGTDSFTFRVSDGSLTSTPVTVSVTVTPVNDAPIAQAQNVTTAEDTAKAITLVATDVETNALTYVIVTNPSHGILSGLTSNVVTYTPDANYYGPDSFTFQASDASLTSTAVTVSVTVTSVNDAPVAQAQGVTTVEDTAKTITLVATDVETNALIFAIVTNPSHGTLSGLTSNVVTYTPAVNYNGTDSFTFRASDASLTSTPATVSITVTPVNDTPVALPQSVNAVENRAKAIALTATDPENDPLIYTIETNPLHGTLSGLTSNVVTYMPSTNYLGSDSFTFRVSDGSLTSTPATVSISVSQFIPSTNAFILIFDPQGGTVDPTNKIVETGIPFGLLPTPVREKYIFLGWFASYLNSAAQITSNTIVNVRADKMIYAKWQAEAITEAGGPNGTGIFTMAVLNGEGTIQCHDSTVSGSMTIPDRIPNALNGTPVTAFERYAFTNMTALTNVVMPLFVADISNFAFSYCSALESVTLIQPFDYQTGQYVSLNIGRMAFGYCESLKQILIPACTTNIGPRAFAYCTTLKDIYFEGELPPSVASNAFTGTAEGGALNVHVPAGAATNYVEGVWTNANLRIVEDADIQAMRTALEASLESTSLEGVQLLVTSATQPIQLGFAVQSSNNLSAAQVLEMLLTNYPERLKVAYRASLTDSWQLLTPDVISNNLNGSATLTVNVPVGTTQGFFKVVIQ
jgi:VCBS repeat-containing protein